MKICRILVFSFIVCLTLQGCITATSTSRNDFARSVAKKAGFSSFTQTGTYFTLQGYSRLRGTAEQAVVYIEGDGKAWRNRRQPSLNPTPANPLALRLAARDQRENVIYLARPCQYISIAKQPNCQTKYWTSHRFASEVIGDYNIILDRLKLETGVQEFHLIGFSGGAAIAALLAASRADVVSLVTVAGNLDLANLAAHHKVSPLNGSLDPVAYAQQLKHIPQTHFIGENDKIIPLGLTKQFFAEQKENPCLQVKVVAGATHLEGWEVKWNQLLEVAARCR